MTGPGPDGATAPLRVRGAGVYTADPEHTVIPRGGVLVVDGRIVAVGPDAEVDRAYDALPGDLRAACRTLDGRDRMVLPGLVNAHWHEMFAMRLPMKGALRPMSDRGDVAGFMGGGGDIHQISGAFAGFSRLIEAMSDDEAEAVARYSLWTQARGGVSTVGDVGSLNKPDAMVRAARALGLRLSVSTWADDAVCAPDQATPRRTRDTDTVLAEIERLLGDCAADTTGRIRCRPSAAYVTNMTDELGRGLGELARRHDVGFATHVGALRHEPDVVARYYGRSGVHRLHELGLLDRRLMAVHTGFADAAERELLLAAGVHISHSPAKYGPAGESSLTETGLIPALREAGLDVSLSTDGQSMPSPGMVEAMRAAWQVYNERVGDQTVVLPTDALAMATRIAARGLGWDERIGSLEVGKEADLLLVRTDDWRYLLNPRPLEAFLTLGGSVDVDTLVVAGRVLLSQGRSVFDAEVLRADYLAALRSFSTRCLGIDAGTVDAIVGPTIAPGPTGDRVPEPVGASR